MSASASAVEPKLIVAFEKDSLPKHLNTQIVSICQSSLQARGAFTIALSGGSLPQVLASLQEEFEEQSVDPQLDKWHVILADERCVPSTDDDSNLKALKENLFSNLPVPSNQIYGIDESKLDNIDELTKDYELEVEVVLDKSGGKLDLAVLGFGPDGHTCSLFPNHALLEEKSKLVASLSDSPKPPPTRITLTFPALNDKTRHVIFCGAGSSKGPILREVFKTLDPSDEAYAVPRGAIYKVVPESPPPYPCAMVAPSDSLTWIVDADAMSNAQSAESPY